MVENHICRNCDELYREFENTATSCFYHKSIWNGDEYWCCGSKDAESPGCSQEKHISREISIQLETKSKFCGSCRKNGHANTDCPEDPNVRSKFILEQELKRIQVLCKILNRKSFFMRSLEKFKLKRRRFRERSMMACGKQKNFGCVRKSQTVVNLKISSISNE